MQTDPEALEHLYKQWPIEKLARALAFERDQYKPEALPAMQRALASHGLSQEELARVFAEVGAEYGAATERLSRIQGILLLFIVIVATNSLIYLFVALVLATAAASTILRVVAVPCLVLGLYGLYCSFLLVRRKSRAPQHAGRWLIWSVVAGTATVVARLVFSREFSLGAALPPVLSLVWLAYLSDSRRVALVYGVPDESAKQQLIS
jgi:hypothetical protein